MPPRELCRPSGPVALGAGTTWITLDCPGLAPRGQAAQPALVLVFEGLRAAAAPGVLYDVSLHPDTSGSVRDDPSRSVGNLNFFAAVQRPVDLVLPVPASLVAAMARRPAGRLFVAVTPLAPPAAGAGTRVGAVSAWTE